MPRPTRRFATLLPALVVAFALCLAVGCGSDAGDEVIGAGQAPEGGGAAAVPVPTLPSVVERQPAAFDAQGCAVTGPDEVDCSSTAADLDRVAAEPVDGWRTLAGFVGPHFVSEVSSGAVVLLDDTVTTSTAGPWTSLGLVRNETPGPVTDLVVEATLVGADGAELERVSHPVAVDPLRPGEPAPFRLESTTDVASVVDVRWSTTSEPALDPVDMRVFELVTWWDRGSDDPEPVDLYLYRDEPNAPLPYLLFGALTNFSGVEAPSPVVVGAWLDEQGRVVAVEETEAITDPVAATGGVPLAAGASADFLFVLGPERSPAVDAGQVMLWGASR